MANLDTRTLRFQVTTSESLSPGDTLVVREIRKTDSGFEIAVISEKALKDEVAKIFR
jgi:hypothetical protein